MSTHGRCVEWRKQLAARHQEKLVNELPDLLRVHSLQYRMLSEQLAQQQRQKMRKLRSIFPLRLVPSADPNARTAAAAASASSASASAQPAPAFPHPPYVSVCNIKIPTSDDYSGVPTKELAAGVGYLLHFTSLTAMYLGSPLLHEPGFKGSASTIWQAQSFWDPRPANAPAACCPLYVSRRYSHPSP